MLKREESKIEEEREKQNKRRNQLMYVLHVIKTNSQINMIRRTLFIFLTILRDVEREKFDALNSFYLYIAALC